MALRRQFIQQLTAIGAGLGLSSYRNKQDLQASLQSFTGMSEDELVKNESYWYQIKNAYTVSPNMLNLNNGGVSPSPQTVQDAVERYHKLSNEAPSFFMWRTLDAGREPLRKRLAVLSGCDAEEVGLCRNASEALETVIFGLPLKKGDEVVLTKQDYPNMINAWKQREKRDGIVLKWVSLDLPSEDNTYLVNKFVEQFNAKTKVVMVTHVINWCGQILPVRDIAREAHKRGIEVISDSAHAFAQLDFKIPDLECDYFGTSLHKWLSAPIGSGMLWIKKDKIKQIYPLFGSQDPESADIRKFEALGTRPFFIEQAIGQAIDFQYMIGSSLKFKRLHYLKNYWCERVMQHPKIKIHTSLKPEFGGAIALVSIADKKPSEVDGFLMEKHKIHTVAIEWDNLSGVRVTPHVYTTTRDLDRLVEGLLACAGS